MSRRAVLIVIGGLLIVGAAAALIILNRLNTFMTPKPLEISFATVQSAMPEDASCMGSDIGGGVAKEIFNLDTDNIYIAGGSNPMPDDVWGSYVFRLPLLQNSNRNLLFNGSCFYRSPGVPIPCQGDACLIIEEIVGYTWLLFTHLAGQTCFPDASGCSGDVVNPGYISISTIAKCHRIEYDGPTIYELADGTGNRYVMHATDDGTPDLAPDLPPGWTLTERAIAEPLIVLPFGGGDTCYHNIVRDNLVQSYHQIAFASTRYPG